MEWHGRGAPELAWYRSGTVNSKFHLIQSFAQIFATFLSFDILKFMANSNMVNWKFDIIKVILYPLSDINVNAVEANEGNYTCSTILI